MKNKLLTALLILGIILAGCTRPTSRPTPTALPSPSRTPVDVVPLVTRTPDAAAAVSAFLDKWKAEDYESMYAMLTKASQAAIKKEDFIARYTDVATQSAMAKDGVDYQIAGETKSTTEATVEYTSTLHSVLVGDLRRGMKANLAMEDGAWHLQWDEGLILPELKGGNRLQMDSSAPERGNIYDRNGNVLVSQSEAVAIGLITADIPVDNDEEVANTIHRVLGIDPGWLIAKIDGYRPQNQYLGLGDLSIEDYNKYEGQLSGLPGIYLSNFTARYYRSTGTISYAAHATGFRSLIQADEVNEFVRQGYKQSDYVSRMGMELWGDPYLGGQRSAVLYLVDPSGNILSELARKEGSPSQDIYTTLDINLQRGAQEAIAGFQGAVVVMERNSGRVLALASSPSFDPNLYVPDNYNSPWLINGLYADTRPEYNRATRGQYPLGSVFKIITMSAALKSGLYTADTTYECGYEFTELPDRVLYDWTWDHYQKDGKTKPSGTLTLPEGLMRSCDPYFYSIGLHLFGQGMGGLVSEMAKGFGLGQKTGIYGLVPSEEEAGQVVVPASALDATNQAIGQGDLMVTPLQVADFVAAVGNGGTLYRPSLIEKIAPPNGQPTYVYTDTVRGTLPISGTMLSLVQNAMVSVIKNSHGTAYDKFGGFGISVAGKTGTAQTSLSEPHAWFVAYSNANIANKPDIAVAVILEYQGEGSDWAAPVTRRVLEDYFYGRPQALYPWESSIGVVKSPTPEVTDTSAPEATETETPTPNP